jgi:hypothetical protein
MSSVRRHRDRIAFGAALAGPPAMAALLLPGRATLQPTDVALLLVVVVVAAVAANGRREPGLPAALGSAVWYDSFWTRPYERRSRRTVRADTAYLSSIHAAAIQSSAGLTVPELIEQVAGQLTDLLALRTARFEQGNYLGHPPRLDEHGELIWDSKPWRLEEHGMPDQEFELRARSNGRTWGRFMLAPTPGTAPSIEGRRVAVVLADQVGAALAGQAIHGR